MKHLPTSSTICLVLIVLLSAPMQPTPAIRIAPGLYSQGLHALVDSAAAVQGMLFLQRGDTAYVDRGAYLYAAQLRSGSHIRIDGVLRWVIRRNPSTRLYSGFYVAAGDTLSDVVLEGCGTIEGGVEPGTRADTSDFLPGEHLFVEGSVRSLTIAGSSDCRLALRFAHSRAITGANTPGSVVYDLRAERLLITDNRHQGLGGPQVERGVYRDIEIRRVGSRDGDWCAYWSRYQRGVVVERITCTDMHHAGGLKLTKESRDVTFRDNTIDLCGQSGGLDPSTTQGFVTEQGTFTGLVYVGNTVRCAPAFNLSEAPATRVHDNHFEGGLGHVRNASDGIEIVGNTIVGGGTITDLEGLELRRNRIDSLSARSPLYLGSKTQLVSGTASDNQFGAMGEAGLVVYSDGLRLVGNEADSTAAQQVLLERGSGVLDGNRFGVFAKGGSFKRTRHTGPVREH